MKNKQFKSGFVTIVGKPNAGKSTIMNAMIGEKIAIVSNKPQTTRNRIMGVVSDEAYQIVFLDTPGIHEPKNKLGEYMMKTVHDAMDGMDCVLVVADASHLTDADTKVIQSMSEVKVPKILALNKTDLTEPSALLKIIDNLKEYGYHDIIPVSGKTEEGLEELKKLIVSYLPEGPQYFPDDMITDQPERLICAEIIREKALHHLRDEVPHGIGVEMMGMEKKNDHFMEINATIYCEKDTHKGIIIGKQGSMLKIIGTEAREDIEKLLGYHVTLKLWVKIREDWRNRKDELRNLGYDA